ncbi:tryptamine hydroxycinnamoyltransferase 2-like [Iris pallida]|uniref:Tryptamine hydroxycinnamoyltransferase 2-like n=1 Tax=Iris pallida TaxID=29817 RepID=A0AAX6HUA0_IRIPA|nr:tryptamine hydroxycinnamoyltransferase 2-like [Iris pallida]
MLPAKGEVDVDPSLLPVAERIDKRYDAFDRNIGWEYHLGTSSPEIHVVHGKPEPAVHLDVRIDYVPPLFPSHHQLLVPSLLVENFSEVDEGPEVAVVELLDGLADGRDVVADVVGGYLSDLRRRECPADEVAEVVHGYDRPHLSPSVDGYSYSRPLVVVVAARYDNLLPYVS